MSRNTKIFSSLLLLLFFVLLANVCLGVSSISPLELVRAVFSGNRESTAARIFWYVRLPRILAAMLAGAALSTSGLLLQSVLRNPLAAPGVIGINSGAGLCAMICLVLFPSAARFVPFAAFIGACLSAFFVWLLARLTGASRSSLVLSGVAVNSLLGACMDGIVTLFPDAVISRSAFSIGGFAGTTLQQLGFAAPLIAAALLAALLLRREISIMALGDDIAHSLGLKVELLRAVFLISAAMLAGAAVSFAGLVGFVGLIAPHIARLICRNDDRLRIPVTIVFGSLLCLTCDLIARTLFSPYELPVGVVLSFLGAPFFLYLLIQKKRADRNPR